jgi:hypothetical protein
MTRCRISVQIAEDGRLRCDCKDPPSCLLSLGLAVPAYQEMNWRGGRRVITCAANDARAIRPQFSIQNQADPPQHTSQTSSTQSTIDESTQKQIKELEAAVAKNRDAVVDKILERVVKCEPTLHRNLTKLGA